MAEVVQLRSPVKTRAARVRTTMDRVGDTMRQVEGAIPGAGLISKLMAEDNEILSDFWLLMLHTESKFGGAERLPSEPVFSITLLSHVEGYVNHDATPKAPNRFLEIESFTGVDRRIFKRQDREFETTYALIQQEIEKNGDVNWPLCKFIFQACQYIVEHEQYEVEQLSDTEFKMTVVTPGVEGYYTAYMNFRGAEERAMLDEYLKRTAN